MGILDNFIYIVFADGRYKLILKGLTFTLQVSLIGTLIGLFFGLILAVCRLSNDFFEESKIKKYIFFNPFYWLASIYIHIIRGTPIIVQLLILYNFVAVGPLKNIPNLYVAGVGVGLNSAAYIAEIIRSGIKGLDKGQMEAARALGMPYIKSMRLVILPQAFKIMIPAFVNEFIVLLKETSVVKFIGGFDLLRASDKITAITYKSLQPLIAVSIVYLALTTIFTAIMNLIEERTSKSD